MTQTKVTRSNTVPPTEKDVPRALGGKPSRIIENKRTLPHFGTWDDFAALEAKHKEPRRTVPSSPWQQFFRRDSKRRHELHFFSIFPKSRRRKCVGALWRPPWVGQPKPPGQATARPASASVALRQERQCVAWLARFPPRVGDGSAPRLPASRVDPKSKLVWSI